MFECLKLYATSSGDADDAVARILSDLPPYVILIIGIGLGLLSGFLYAFLLSRKMSEDCTCGQVGTPAEGQENPNNPERVKGDYVIRGMTEDKGTGKRVWVLETGQVSGEDSE